MNAFYFLIFVWYETLIGLKQLLSFNEILKVCYCRFHTAIKKKCLSDDVNYFLEKGNSSFSPIVYKIITNLQTSYTSRVEMNTEV